MGLVWSTDKGALGSGLTQGAISFDSAGGLLELDAVWISVALLIGLEAVHFTVSHVVQPRMQGQSLNIDPIVVLLSLAFWGIVFGIGGAFLSTPLTVVVMAICAEFPASRGIAVLLSQNGKPFAP